MYAMSVDCVRSAGLVVESELVLDFGVLPVMMNRWYSLSLVGYLPMVAAADLIQVDGDCDGEFQEVVRLSVAGVSSLMVREAI